MFPQENQINSRAESKTYPLVEKIDQTHRRALALVALSHTPLEHRLYSAMLAATNEQTSETGSFSARQLMLLTGVGSPSTIRRGLDSLVTKLSISRKPNGQGLRQVAYFVHTPEKIIELRSEAGNGRESGGDGDARNHPFERALSRVLEAKNLSRREAQVALYCVEGLTNAEIGGRLHVTEQTVKFHMRHVFIKFAVKRRAELISRLLR